MRKSLLQLARRRIHAKGTGNTVDHMSVPTNDIARAYKLCWIEDELIVDVSA